MSNHLLDNATEVLRARSDEIWQDSTHRIVVVGERNRYTAIIKTSVVRIEGPTAQTICGALEMLLEHTARMLVYEKEEWEDMSYGDRRVQEELVEHRDGSRYAQDVNAW